MKKEDYVNLYNDYVECKLTTDELCKKYGIMKSVIDMVIKEFANRELDGDLTSYYKALAKRRKIYKEKQEEDRKKKEAELELERQYKNIREIKYTLNSFLDSDLNEENFCAKHKFSIKYFEDSLYDIKDIDRKMYMSVKAKFYTDYVKEQEEKYEEKQQQKQYNEFEPIQDIMKKYMSSSGSIDEFCNKNNISKLYFQNSVYSLKQNNSKLYSLVKDKLCDDIVNSSEILRKIITKVAYMAQYKVTTVDGKKRDFTLLDYYKMTNIDINNLVLISKRIGMQAEYKILNKFIQKNIDNMKKINIEQNYNDLNEADTVTFRKTVTYMKNNNLPNLIGIYNILFKKFKDKTIIKNQQENNEGIIKTQNIKRSNEQLSQDENINYTKKMPKMDDILEEEFKLKIDDEDVITEAMNYVIYGEVKQEEITKQAK